MLNIRTLADIWSTLSVEERMCIVLEKYHAEMPKVPATLRSAGYADCVADIEWFVLDRHPLPPADWQ